MSSHHLPTHSDAFHLRRPRTNHVLGGRLGQKHMLLAPSLAMAPVPGPSTRSPLFSPPKALRPAVSEESLERSAPIAIAPSETPRAAPIPIVPSPPTQVRHFDYVDEPSRGRSRHRTFGSHRGRATARGRRAPERDRGRGEAFSTDVVESSSPLTFSRPVPAVDAAAPPALEQLAPLMARRPAAEDAPEAVEPAFEDAYLPFDYPHGTSELASEDVKYTRSRLPALGPQSLHLWRALHKLRPLTYDYAGAFGVASPAAPHPLVEGADASACPVFAAAGSPQQSGSLALIKRVFNWDQLELPVASSGEWYGVVFRSRRQSGSESTSLYDADRHAHEEAVNAGGLLMYW